MPGTAEYVRIVEDRMYVAAASAGLQMFELKITWPQEIVANLPEQLPLRREPLTLKPSASSGLPVTATLLSGPARLDGNQLTLTGTGLVTIRFEQGGNDHFLPAGVVQQLRVSELTAESVVNTWIAQNVPSIAQDQRGLLADPDGDGVPNALECLLKTNPGVKALGDGRLPAGRITTSDGQVVWEIVIELDREIASVLHWQFESSSALAPEGWRH